MCRRALVLATALCAAAACYGPPDLPQAEALPVAQESTILLQAVDAGTGGVLTDPELTVRYLVRAPIVVDSAAVERVPSVEPYEISIPVRGDSLVVEVRLEAHSYHRVDTVFAVARGASAGPLTVRLARRLDLLAEAEAPEPGPAPPEPARTPPARPAADARSADRVALAAGNRAFAQERWLEATEAYARLTRPDDPDSEYGRAYQEALLRWATAHMNRSEYAAALDVLEIAAGYGSPGYAVFLRLAEAQCAVGRTDEGRGTLAELERTLNRRSESEQLVVRALIEYERGVCAHGEFDRAETTRERVRTGAAAIRQLQDFIDFGERIEPVPPAVQRAIEDARARIETIRRRMTGE